MAHKTEKERRIEKLVKILVDHADNEDREVRERQVRLWRKLKLYWDGFQRLWYSEVAKDWKTVDSQTDQYSSYYDKPVNVFRSYLESLIAALSISTPAIKCYPDDADDPLDLATARAGDKIAELISKHNDAPLLWIHALFIYVTEGLVAAYRYTKADEEFGTYETNQYETREEQVTTNHCPNCDTELVDENVCPECMAEIEEPSTKSGIVFNEVMIGKKSEPKSRQCIEVYGGLYVKIPNYAMKQEDCPYLIWAYETHYANIKERYPDAGITGGSPYSAHDYYERWGRVSNQYMGEEPVNILTCRNCWIRPNLYHILDDDDARFLKKEFPTGLKAVLANETFCEVIEEKLDDHWVLTKNPVSDFLHHEPIGTLLTNVQDITSDLVALVLQTIEHAIPMTFADPSVLNFTLYKNTEATPGLIFPVSPKAGKSVSDSFYEVRMSTLSREIEPFMQRVQELGQLVSGALPSLFGGTASGSSRTAAEYSMSRAQAQQRLQIAWKMLCHWWARIFKTAIPAYITNMVDDERIVNATEYGNFINVFIRKAEVQGKIGRVELEANENLPTTWAQKKDTIMELLQTNNPEILEAIGSVENIGVLANTIGLSDFILPNQNDIEKQHEEIQMMLMSQPMPSGNGGEMGPDGQPMPEQEFPSIIPDYDVDNHAVEGETTKRWLVSPAGREAKNTNPLGYKNVLLHLKMHNAMIQVPMMPQQAQGPGVPTNGNGPTEQQPAATIQ